MRLALRAVPQALSHPVLGTAMEGMDLPVSSRVGQSTASAGNPWASLQAGLELLLDGLTQRIDGSATFNTATAPALARTTPPSAAKTASLAREVGTFTRNHTQTRSRAGRYDTVADPRSCRF